MRVRIVMLGLTDAVAQGASLISSGNPLPYLQRMSLLNDVSHLACQETITPARHFL